MRRLTALALLAGLIASPASGQDKTYDIKFKKSSKGDRVRNVETVVRENTILLEAMGQEVKEEFKHAVRLAYILEVLERPAEAKYPTKQKRTYQTAERTKDGVKRTLPYEGKTVLIEKKGVKYEFTVDGELLSGDAAEELDEDFNSTDFPQEKEHLLPGKPVRLNEAWTADAARVAKESESGMFVLDAEKTRLTGRLTKVYEKGGRQFGVIEMDMILAVRERKVDGKRIAMRPDSSITYRIVHDGCIDGTSYDWTQTMTWRFVLKRDGPREKLTLTGSGKSEWVAEDLRSK